MPGPACLLWLPVGTAKVATTRFDGRAHVAPVWYDVDAEGIAD